MVEMLNVLFGSVLRHRPEDPRWPERDIFILSKGHAVLGYFAVPFMPMAILIVKNCAPSRPMAVI